MKTLKKTLCLVLALVMAFSLMSVASATNLEKYTDADKVGAAYEEAVDVLLGLGIVNGVSATELSPEGYYTRAQAAKIATYLAVGPTVAEMLPAGDSFEDVPAKHWAAKYISYCAEKGILNGVTATTYDPEAYVTGYQFAKMILAAAGYGQNNEFVGSGWAIATAQWALDADNNLFKGDAKAATNDPITRQQAMLIAFNALQNVEFVKYSKDTGVYTDISADTMGKAKYAMNAAVEGLVNKNAANDAAYAKKTQVGTTDYAVVTGADLLNHWVRVYTTGTGTDTKTVAVVDLSTVVEVTKATTTAAEWDALFGATDIKNTAGVTVTGMTLNTIAPVGTYILNGVELKAYVAPQTYYATVVNNVITTAGSEGIDLRGVSSVLKNNATTDEVNEYAGIAKNDIVYYTINGGIYNLTKVAAPVEGTITVKDGTKLTVNGTVYEASTIADNAAIANDLWNGTTLSTVNFKDTYKLYLDNAGKYFAIVKVTNAAVQSDIVYTVATFSETTTDAYGTPSTKIYAQTVDLNGVEGKVLVTTASTGFGTYALSSNETQAKAGIMVQSAAPSSYATTTPIFETDAVGGALTTKSTSMSTDAGKAYITAESSFIFIDGSKASMKVEVVNGGVNFTIPADASVLLTKDADGNYIVKTVIINGKYTNAGVNAADYLYVADAQSAPAQTADGYVFTVYAAATGEKMTITASNTTLDNAFYSYKVVDGVYTLTKDTSNTNLILGEDYTSKFGTKITSTNLTDKEAGSAIVVDTRTATEITSSKVAALTSIDAIHAAENATSGAVNVAFDVVVGTDGIVAIYVTGTSAK